VVGVRSIQIPVLVPVALAAFLGRPASAYPFVGLVLAPHDILSANRLFRLLHHSPQVKRGLRALALAGASLVVGLASSTASGRRLDEAGFATVNRGHGEAVDRVFSSVTELGSVYASGAAAITLAGMGHRRVAVRAAAAAGTTWLIGQALKEAFGRPRPYHAPHGSRLMIGRPAGTSWPSSHPAVIATFVAVAGRQLDVSRGGRAGLGALSGVVAASRVVLGVHYPSDVIGGLLLGRAVGAAWPDPREPDPRG
jgi:membrane-associated phospholipid phosphatase